MSSDVYIYLSQQPDPVHNDDHVCRRLGDLGVMSYFGFDLMTFMCALKTHRFDRIDAHWLRQAKVLVRAFHEEIAKDQQMSETDFPRTYGYMGPLGIEWEDVPTQESIQRIYDEYQGYFWNISWD